MLSVITIIFKSTCTVTESSLSGQTELRENLDMGTVAIPRTVSSQAFFFKKEQRGAHVPCSGCVRGFNATEKHCHFLQSHFCYHLREKVDIKGKGNVKFN